MIHKYKLFEKNIVLDVYSGAVFNFDDIAYGIVDEFEDTPPKKCPPSLMSRLLKKHKKEDILSAYEEILSLCDEGLLFSKDEYTKVKEYSRRPPVKALCLHIAHDCNLRCEYCFAAKGDFNQGRSFMDFETGKKAIDFVIKNSQSRRNIEIDYFGGEPLMNFDTIKKITDYAKHQGGIYNKNFRFTVTTNGVLLNDEIADYINENMSNVVLSLDGRREINDQMRKRVNGGGSYDDILPKFINLVKKRDKDYYIRGTFTKHNKDFSKDVLHLADLGFYNTSIEPVVADESLPYAIAENDLPEVFLEYEKLAKEIYNRKLSGKGFNFFHFMIDLEQGPCVIKRLRGCGCGSEYVAITPSGDIYPCHQFVGMSEFKMGNVHDGIEVDKEISGRFAKTNIYSKQDCKTCWAKFYCSGGCSANNQQYNNDINAVHKISCELEKKRVECAIWLKIALLEKNKQ